MTTYAITCYQPTGQSLRHYIVEEAIYNYIKQLEAYIKNPNKSKLKEVYGFRFSD